MQSSKPASLFLLRISISLLVLVPGIDELVNPEHALGVSDHVHPEHGGLPL